MKGIVIIAAAALGALAVAGCGSSGSSSASATTAAKTCVASIGFEAPITGPVAVLGQEQLHFAQLALSMDNAANKTKISLVQGDTQLNPAQATTVTQQFTSNSKIVAVVGPAGSQEVEAVGPLFGRAGIAFISGIGDRRGAHHRQVPDVLPGRVEGQRAGTAGRQLHRQHPAPEGPDDRRRPGGLLNRPGCRDDADLQDGRDPGRSRVGLAEDHRLLLAGRQGHARHIGRGPALAGGRQCSAVRPRPRPAAQERRDLRHGRPVLAGHASRSTARTCPRSARTSPRFPPMRRWPPPRRRSTDRSARSARRCSRRRT